MNKLIAMLGLLAAPLGAAGRWELQYFYDEARSSLNITEIAFPTARRGIAVGRLTEGERQRGAAVLTTDGGAHWTLVPLPAPAMSLFFLDETVGWVVTTKGLYRSDEGGRSWRKINAPREILRVYFLDAAHGFAVGMKKSVFETVDGGKKWTRLAASDAPKGRPEFTVYNWITFVSPQLGMIVGWNRPPRGDDARLPGWMEPERAPAEFPNLSISLETGDAGKTWKPATVSIFGRITRVRLVPDGRGLGLIEFSEAFPYPSDVFLVKWKGGATTRVYRSKDRAVTDVALMSNGPAYLAAVEVPGQNVRAPIPSRLRMLKSDDMALWQEMEVDYRANARRAVMGWSDPKNVWVATDTGMILKLVE